MALLRALRRRAALATFDRTAALREEQRWRFTDDGLEIAYAGGDAKVSKLPWRDIARVEETRDGFGFVVSLQRTGFLPRRAVRDAEMAALRELLARVNAPAGSRDS